MMPTVKHAMKHAIKRAIKQTPITVAMLLTIVALGACGERDQSLPASVKKTDGKPWQGAANAYAVPGWKAGDQAAWERQMRTRGQFQNEYNKTN